ncbi:MAG: hypothetical protein US22_C0015G0008, partial [candidate division TM6 bacterium GW2011_GWF2_36_6]
FLRENNISFKKNYCRQSDYKQKAFFYCHFDGNNFNNKKHLIVISILAILIFFFTFKRTPIIMISIGFFFLFFTLRNVMLKFMLFLVVVFAIYGGSYIIDELSSSKRDKFSLNVNTENEGRFIEIVNINELMKNDNGLLLFGNGKLFFTRGEYGLTKFEDRPIHSFYGEILLGTGYIGLILFVLLIFIILSVTISKNRISKKNLKISNDKDYVCKFIKDNTYLKFIYCAISILIFTSFVGSIRYIGYNGLFFLILGATIGQLYQLYRNGIYISNYNQK